VKLPTLLVYRNSRENRVGPVATKYKKKTFLPLEALLDALGGDVGVEGVPCAPPEPVHERWQLRHHHKTTPASPLELVPRKATPPGSPRNGEPAKAATILS
jgi:hypothetical protein